MQFQSLVAADLPSTVRAQLHSLYTSIWPHTPSDFVWEGCYGPAATWHLGWNEHGSLIACATTAAAADASSLVHLYNVGVHPEFRRQGVGRRLLAYVADWWHTAPGVFGWITESKLLPYYLQCAASHQLALRIEAFQQP